MNAHTHSGHVLALCGGIGGAKLALGLYRMLDPQQLTVVVNTGDDFEHLGLKISPDLDTVLYTLGGVADPERGWGRAQETWEIMAALCQLGERDLVSAWRSRPGHACYAHRVAACGEEPHRIRRARWWSAPNFGARFYR